VVKPAKNAFKSIQGLPRDMSEDSLLSEQEQLWAIAGHARQDGFKHFLDDKTYKPGLEVYKSLDKKYANGQLESFVNLQSSI
jgi:type I restriction-modification system DNA methylase subunit